jgi:hypothetical protein
VVTASTYPADPHVGAWLAKINAELATMDPPRAAYEYDDAPLHGGDYVIVFLTRTTSGEPRNAWGAFSSSWRLAIRAVGVGVTNARVLLDRVNKVVENGTITTADGTSTPARPQTEDPIRQDEQLADLWSGLRSYTYSF